MEEKVMQEVDKSDFIEFKWHNHVNSSDGAKEIKTETEHIHKDMLDVLKIYVHLNLHINGMDISTFLKQYSGGRRRAAIRAYCKSCGLVQNDVTTLLKAQTALTRAGHGMLANQIWAIFWAHGQVKIGNYISIVELLKTAECYTILPTSSREAIKRNIGEMSEYDSFETIEYRQLRNLEALGLVFKISHNSRTKRNVSKRINIWSINHNTDGDDKECEIESSDGEAGKYITYKYAELSIKQRR